MKKTLLKSISVLCLTVILLSSLAGCSHAKELNKLPETERGIELYKIATENLDLLKSLAVEYTIDFTFKAEDKEQSLNVSALTTAFTNEKDEYSEITEMKFEMSEADDVEHAKYGYTDGKFFWQEGEKNSDIVYCEMTLEEYASLLNTELDSPITNINVDNCKSISCVYNEDKTWKITFEDFTYKKLLSFGNIMGYSSIAVSEEIAIEDVKMVVNVTKDFLIDNITLDYEFSAAEGSELPTLSVLYDFKDYNAVEKPEKIYFDLASEIKDLGIAYKTELALGNIINSDKIEFETKTENRTMMLENGHNSTNISVIYIDATITDEGLEYALTSVINNLKPTEYSYSNGSLTGKDKEIAKTSDIFELARIEKTFSQLSPSIADIKTIEVDEENENKFIITYKVDSPENYLQLNPGYKADDSTVTVTVEFDGETIVYYKESLVMNIRQGTKDVMKHTYTATTTFEK